MNTKLNETEMKGIHPQLPFHPHRNAVFSLRQSILTSKSQDAPFTRRNVGMILCVFQSKADSLTKNSSPEP